VIKFRCLNCGQKLAVSDDGVNAVISCTNCREAIVVPPYSYRSSFPRNHSIIPARPAVGAWS